MFKTARQIYIFSSLVLMAAVLCLLYGYYVEPERLVINPITVEINGWDPAFDGLKIVSIGDIHGGSNGVTEQKIRDVVAAANAQHADLIVLLGDYVSEKRGPRPAELKMPMETIAASLAGLEAKLGVFAILGNHDGWYSDQKVAAELTKVGYKVLQNEAASVEMNGSRLRIMGFKDHLQLRSWKETSDTAKAALSSSGQGSIIALEHSPDILPAITDNYLISPDLKLVLAAHTHGGQVRLPILGSLVVPSSFGQKYVYGHIRDHNMDMVVTSGIGMSVLPFRFMVPPEIQVITVRSKE